MNRKEEFRKFVGNGLSKRQFDLCFKIWSNMKDVVDREHERKMVRRFTRKLERKVAIARRDALKGIRGWLEYRKSRPEHKRLSENHRKKIARLLKEMSNGN